MAAVVVVSISMVEVVVLVERVVEVLVLVELVLVLVETPAVGSDVVGDTTDGCDVGIAVGTAVGSERVSIMDGVAVGLELAGDSVGATPTMMSLMMCCVRRDAHKLVFSGRTYTISL